MALRAAELPAHPKEVPVHEPGRLVLFTGRRVALVPLGSAAQSGGLSMVATAVERRCRVAQPPANQPPLLHAVPLSHETMSGAAPLQPCLMHTPTFSVARIAVVPL